MRFSAKQGAWVRFVCLLCVALVGVMGVVQATHSHPEDSTAPHHACSICATAHAGINTHKVVSAPVLATLGRAILPAEVSLSFGVVVTPCIRPPPAA